MRLDVFVPPSGSGQREGLLQPCLPRSRITPRDGGYGPSRERTARTAGTARTKRSGGGPLSRSGWECGGRTGEGQGRGRTGRRL